MPQPALTVGVQRNTSPAVDKEIEDALDKLEPGWRARAKASAEEKAAEKAARLEKLKADRESARATKRAAAEASGKNLRPATSNTAAPTAEMADKRTPKTERTIARLQAAWCDALFRAGKTESTVHGYRAEVQKAVEHFGEAALVADLTPAAVAGFNDSERVTKTRTGRTAAKPGVDKTRRALRMALAWAAAAGWVAA